MSRAAKSSGVAAAPLTLFEPARFAAAPVSGLADAFAALVTPAAAEARTAVLLRDFPAAEAAPALASDALRTAGCAEPLPEPGPLPLPVPAVPTVAFAPVVFAIAFLASPMLDRFCQDSAKISAKKFLKNQTAGNLLL
ncbi:hypothetical protein LJR230_005006 [Trinickia sp. LjRoot230]